MSEFLSTKSEIRNRSDMAKLVGLCPGARRRDIYSAFGRATRCEAWLEIEEIPVMRHSNEVWEIKVLQENPKCRILLRHGGRGKWMDDPVDVPADVLRFLDARIDRNNGVVSNRSWKIWQKMRWAKGRGRRLNGKSCELHVIVEVENVGRPTGELRSSLIIEALGAPYPDMVEPVKLNLPVKARDIGAAVATLKEKCQMQTLIAA